MKNNIIYIVIALLVGFGAGYICFPDVFGARTADPYSNGWSGDCLAASTTTIVEGIVADCN